MSIDSLKSHLPDFAKDQRLNLAVLTTANNLSPVQTGLVAVASAATARNGVVLAACKAQFQTELGDDGIAAALAAASVMAMNNVYYRFTHYVAGADVPTAYAAMPARLRMQSIGNPGVAHLDFELACLAASAINGCENCVRSHEQAVRQRGGTQAAVHDAVRIAAVVHSLAVAIEAAKPSTAEQASAA